MTIPLTKSPAVETTPGHSHAVKTTIEVSVVMPCLNEAETIGTCISRAQTALRGAGLVGEVVVSDNGSTDDSVVIAERLGARVVHETALGYGAAYMRGIAAARGQHIVIGDSDDTYDFGDLPRLIAPLREGCDLVMGSRFKGEILPGAMPWANRYVGNPMLTGMLNLLFQLKVSDAHSGLRAFTREAYDRMQLQTTGMEFASEMIIKASLAGLKIAEVPITYHPRRGDSKLHPLKDAWRHVRFMLLFSPLYLFLLPGSVAMTVGLLLIALLFRGPLRIGAVYLGIHFMVLGSLLAVLGQQLLAFGISARMYAFSEKLLRPESWVHTFRRYFKLERGLLVGGSLAFVGLITLVYIFGRWLSRDPSFDQLIYLHEAIAASTLLMMGMQLVMSSFFISLLDLHKKQHATPHD
jgi:glycosyltransferase involved in cell wall biosynthesis